MSPRVLIVDDELALLGMLQDILTLLGCTPVAVPTLQEGLDKTCEESFDLILLDNHFPEGHADSVLPALLEAGPDTPIVMITANEGDAHVRTALHMGVREVLSKPFGLDDLIAVIERYCPAFSNRECRVA